MKHYFSVDMWIEDISDNPDPMSEKELERICNGIKGVILGYTNRERRTRDFAAHIEVMQKSESDYIE